MYSLAANLTAATPSFRPSGHVLGFLRQGFGETDLDGGCEGIFKRRCRDSFC